MRDRDVAPRPTPVLPESCFEALLQAVKANLGRLLATWDALTAAARRYASDERKQGRGLLAYLFANLTEVPVRESKFIEGSLLAMTDSASKWQVADRVLLLSDFEELLLSVARTELPAEDQEPVYHFVHALSAKLVRAAKQGQARVRTFRRQQSRSNNC